MLSILSHMYLAHFCSICHSLFVPHASSSSYVLHLLLQIHLDIHFLVEIAQFRGYCSDDLMAAAINTLVQFGATYDEFESNSDR